MNKIWILDFGSQYTQLIARKVRALNVCAEIVPYTTTHIQILSNNVSGIILSGGPASVLEENSPKLSFKVEDIAKHNIPILGICYGMQLIAQQFKGVISSADRKEYGFAFAKWEKSKLFSGLSNSTAQSCIWASHGDSVVMVPDEFKVIATTNDNPITGVEHSTYPIYGLQFHPEVTHTGRGTAILDNFLNICNAHRGWTTEFVCNDVINNIRETVSDDGRVAIGLSGGVDSSVVAILCQKAVEHRIIPIHIDTGLNRIGEAESVRSVFSKFNMNVKIINASRRFFKVLDGITDPEEKRKIIGKEFADIFMEAIANDKRVKWLAQGTLYPDVIESTSAFGGPSSKIKTHHNVGGIPANFGLGLIEPLKMLFKDEVREIGRTLNLPEEVINKEPIPGPAMGIRCVGLVNEERVEQLRKADQIVKEEIAKTVLDEEVWQAFAISLPIRSVGVAGDNRTYKETCVIRVVSSSDGMTANWISIPPNRLREISTRISNECNYGRILFDTTDKPQGTIEWE